MHITVEETHGQMQALLVYQKKTPFIQQLEKSLVSHGIDIFTSSKFPARLAHFSYLFVSLPKTDMKKLTTVASLPKTLLLFDIRETEFSKIASFLKKNQLTNCKAIVVDHTDESEEKVAAALWFLFSKSDENVLQLHFNPLKKKTTNHLPQTHQATYIHKKNIVAVVIGLFIVIHTFFFLPLAASLYGLNSSIKSVRKGDFNTAKKTLSNTMPFIHIANSAYKLARPMYSLFFIALPLDDIFVVTNNTQLLLSTVFETEVNMEHFLALFFNTTKSDAQKKETRDRFILLQQQSKQAFDALSLVESKIGYLPVKPPKDILDELTKTKDLLEQTTKALPRVNALLSKDHGEYIVFFANNMELRPGGGFIGSYATLTIGDYTLKKIDVEDVYEADGQLVEHIDPPRPIRQFLNQPHWFLRDSFFSPDFKKNFAQAEIFLEKELGKKTFDGGMLVTTTAITYMLDAFGEVYIPDYQEIITKDNFYIKTQLQVEQDFFPGSKQKKNFLSSLVRVLLEKVKTTPPQKLTQSIARALDEKHIVLYFKDKTLQQFVDQLGFGGGLIDPQCAQGASQQKQIPCIADYLYPVDANLGVNKANFYIKRSIQLDVDFTQEKVLNHTYSQLFINNSPSDIFPGGTYKNYFQLHLPRTANISGVEIENAPIDQFDTSTSAKYKTVGIYLEIPPKNQKKITIRYSIPKIETENEIAYQLITQKQIGTVAADVIIRLSLPQSMSVRTQNFSALAKDSQLLYNTTLSNDKIFLVSFSKK